MQLEHLFQQDINRTIETVIKADDDKHIFQEVDEYVITNEIRKKITPFFEAYNDYQGANGVWISGFFGSGKSHLLKILSYVLEDKSWEERKLSEIFAAKADDELLRGSIQKATRIPSESILFNIDNRAEVSSKEQPDAVLSVFYRVFYEHLGFFGTKTHVGDFEYWLWEEGIYDAFRKSFNEISQRPWDDARRQYFLPDVKQNVGKVLSQLLSGTPEEYKDILATFQKDHTKVIDDFCAKVNAYIHSKEPDFRLNFFVDEIGQYISDNTKLMLNLQTIAETLATKSNGQAWVLVTSQQDMESVVGELKDTARNDFSRIQDRFKNRIPLTSSSVDEVIEKRLLAKKEAVEPELRELWDNQKANLNTILRFEEVGIQLRHYTSESDFVRKYPFVNYQFDLFQSCIRELSKHSAFEGLNASVGERSMLGVFKEVMMDMQQENLGQLVAFDQLFSGIRSTIKSEVLAAISLAERNLDNQLAIRTLKALFMVKYFRQFSATTRNISILLISNIHVNIQEHEEAVKEALNILEQQVYIQRNGEVYEFLTNEEKDIEQEIKNTTIDPGSAANLLGTLLFGDIISGNRMRYEDNKQEYSFIGMVDDQRIGRGQHELVLEVITPDFPDYDNPTRLQARTMANNTQALFQLPFNQRLIPDTEMFLKTERYLRHNQATGITPRKQLIHQEKGQQNTVRRRKIIETLRRDLGKATVFLGSGKLELTPSEDGKNLVHRAFQKLISVAYPNLRMLGTATYTEDTVNQVFRVRQEQLFGSSPDGLNEAEQDVLSWISRQKHNSQRVNVQGVLDHYARQPYGWYDYATLTMLGRLLQRGKLEAWRSGELLEGDVLRGGLLNNRQRANIELEPRRSYDATKVAALQNLYRELFDESCPESEARAVARAFRQMLKEQAASFRIHLQQQSRYPFLAPLNSVVETYDRIAQRDEEKLLEDPSSIEDDLLDAKEDYVSPILTFMNGDQVNIFDKIYEFNQSDHANLRDVDAQVELQTIEQLLNSDKPYRGTLLREAKAAMDQISARIREQLELQRETTLVAIETQRERVSQFEGFAQLSPEQQQKVLLPFEEVRQQTKEERFIYQLKQTANQVAALYTRQANEVLELITPQVQEPPSGLVGNATRNTPSPQPRPKRLVNARDIPVNNLPPEIASPQDLEAYLEALRRAYREQLEQGVIINL